jgi:hypothetical protein
MTTPEPAAIPIDQIVARVAAGHQRLLDAIASLTPAQLQAPVLGADGWSVKDVLAHLAFWDRRLLYAIDPGEWPAAGPATGALPSRRFPPPIADIPYDDAWLEAVNARIYARNRARELDDVLAEFTATRRRLLAIVATLSPHAVFDPDGLSASLGEPFAPMLLGAYEHYEEHAEELEAHKW